MENQIATRRNQSIECFKLIASLVVVLLHVNFPDTLQKYIDCIGSIAVPAFFTISGYFNWRSDRNEVLRKIKKLLKLYLTAWVFAMVVHIIATELTGGSTVAFLKTYPRLDGAEIAKMLVLHQDPRNAQLWYLLSLISCELFLVLYLDFRREDVPDYRPLYTLAACLFAVFWMNGCIALPQNISEIRPLLFNGYFFGLPFFAFGIFLHENQQRILENLRLTPGKLTAIFLAGIALSLLQAFTIGAGVLPLGGVLEIPALMLLMIACPRMPARTGLSRWFLRRCGSWSAYIYIFHITVIVFYQKMIQAPLLARLGDLEHWLTPIICVALSVISAAVYDEIRRLLRRLHPAK